MKRQSLGLALLFFTLILACSGCSGLANLNGRIIDWLAGYDRDLSGAPESPAAAETEEDAELPAAGNKADRIGRLAQEITAGAAGDYEKMVAVYDWVTANFAYDLEKSRAISENRARGRFGSGALYLLETGKGVCHDFAELTRALLEALDITATSESGEVQAAHGEWELHAWNHVLVDDTEYALDTTWGAGVVLPEENKFIPKPRRIYLTSPAELHRLHYDPDYRLEKEMDYARKQAAGAEAVSLPDYERRLLDLFNREREWLGLPLLAEDSRLQDLARSCAVQMIEVTIAGNYFSMDGLEKELDRKARQLRISFAGMAAYMQLSYSLPSPDLLFEGLISDQNAYHREAQFTGFAAGVVKKGDIIMVVHIYLEYY